MIKLYGGVKFIDDEKIIVDTTEVPVRIPDTKFFGIDLVAAVNSAIASAGGSISTYDNWTIKNNGTKSLNFFGRRLQKALGAYKAPDDWGQYEANDLSPGTFPSGSTFLYLELPPYVGYLTNTPTLDGVQTPLGVHVVSDGGVCGVLTTGYVADLEVTLVGVPSAIASGPIIGGASLHGWQPHLVQLLGTDVCDGIFVLDVDGIKRKYALREPLSPEAFEPMTAAYSHWRVTIKCRYLGRIV